MGQFKKKQGKDSIAVQQTPQISVLILTPRKPVTTVMGVRSESAADIVANTWKKI